MCGGAIFGDLRLYIVDLLFQLPFPRPSHLVLLLTFLLLLPAEISDLRAVEPICAKHYFFFTAFPLYRMTLFLMGRPS